MKRADVSRETYIESFPERKQVTDFLPRNFLEAHKEWVIEIENGWRERGISAEMLYIYVQRPAPPGSKFGGSQNIPILRFSKLPDPLTLRLWECPVKWRYQEVANEERRRTLVEMLEELPGEENPLGRIWTASRGTSLPMTPEASDILVPRAETVETTTYRILRDTELARQVKAMHRYRCQKCGHTIQLPDGSFYAEAHHIQPLGSPHDGPDVMENILCLCPNHHAELDYGASFIRVSEMRHVEGHVIGPIYVEYHNRTIYRGSAPAEPRSK